ncbi:MAG TPA: CAP domain-containing protein [Polyangiaceae bacterium]|nr:CAP domain-containing protein [Polyangiaceae bacterium]
MTLPSSAARGAFGLLLCAAALFGCNARRWAIDTPLPSARGSADALPASPRGDELETWASSSESPRPAPPGLGLPGCGRPEQSLFSAAREVAQQTADHQPWDVSDVVAQVRAAGGPFVWPRAWTLEGSHLDAAELESGLTAWLERTPPIGERRCGTAQVKGKQGGEVFAAVVVDVLADLDALPTRARLGQWIRLRARLLTGAQYAETVLLGPRGVPRIIPSELRPAEVRAVFNLDQPGMWRIQLLLSGDRGPRPAAEAWIFVDEEPHLAAAQRPAPGEELAASSASVGDLRARLLEMLNAARRSEQRLPVHRDPRLDQLAQAHAEAMRASRQTAHDVGQGLPPERVRRAGIHAAVIGENVAHASSLGRAHRSLWDSPAHRATLLDPRFSAVGIGVALGDEARVGPLSADVQGVATNPKSPAVRTGAAPDTAVLGARGDPEVWVCELFAN